MTWAEYGYEIVRDNSSTFIWNVYSAFKNFETYEKEKIMKRWWGDKHRFNPHYYFKEYRDLILSKPIQDAAWRYLKGKRAYVTHSKISLKEYGKDSTWFEHQDSAYKKEPVEGFTCAIFLEKCTQENGTLEMGVGSHRFGKFPHERLGNNQLAISPFVIGDIYFYPVSGTRGDILFFHFNTIHRSYTNNRPESKRLIFIFEIQEMKEPTLDEAGKLPIVFGEPLRFKEKLEAYWKRLWK